MEILSGEERKKCKHIQQLTVEYNSTIEEIPYSLWKWYAEVLQVQIKTESKSDFSMSIKHYSYSQNQ